MAIDRAIRIARALRGYSRAELAARAGISASYLTLVGARRARKASCAPASTTRCRICSTR